MKVRIIINTWRKTDDNSGYQTQSEVWRGDLDITDKDEYLTRIVMIAEGQEHPICDVPFAIGSGHWMWIPPDNLVEREEDEINSWTQELQEPELTYRQKRRRILYWKYKGERR